MRRSHLFNMCLIALVAILSQLQGVFAQRDHSPEVHKALPCTYETGGLITDGQHLRYKVGFLGIPFSVEGDMHIPIEWNEENISKLKLLGFNMIQLNVAWGSRPGDEPLNIEDVVELSPDLQVQYPQTVPLRCAPSPERREQRRAELRHRIELCRKAGMRTLFHFGAPYNAHSRYGDGPPNCISDPGVSQRYIHLLEVFAREFPGVDDILVYTYDQDAWLCSEFGPCPRCSGIPLHERLVPFLDQLSATWLRLNPQGCFWWEPWELSAGQSLECVERVNPVGFGLMLHCNTAEVMSTLPVDRWFKNMCFLASKREIPVIGEYFLGGASEELEPFVNLSHPLVTLRGLKALAGVPGISGIKEYYGLAPDREDPNLRMTGLFFKNSQITEGEALRLLAEPYGKTAEDIAQFWQLTSEGMELFPWETSWLIREIGRSRPDHSLSAAILRGMNVPTPSWRSTRYSIFMRIEPAAPPDPWMLEDVQLRCELAARSMKQALEIGNRITDKIPQSLRQTFDLNLVDLAAFRRRALAYANHLRETNLTTLLRKTHGQGQPAPEKMVTELLRVMKNDLMNFEDDQTSFKKMRTVEPESSHMQASTWKEMEDAILLLQKDVDAFLKTYFLPAEDQNSKGIFSVTSP
jgi:hypothetical protein